MVASLCLIGISFDKDETVGSGVFVVLGKSWDRPFCPLTIQHSLCTLNTLV